MKPYPKYRDSGVEWIGEVPEGWGVKRMKYLTTKVGSGITPKGGASVYQNSGIALIRSQNIHFDGLRMDNVAYISEEIHASMSASKVRPLDVLLNITGASIGRCSMVPETFMEANVNQHVCIIRPNENISSTFLHAYLSSDKGQLQIFLVENGISREGLNFEQLKMFDVVVPPNDDQFAISAYLDRKTAQIDDLIVKKSRSIELLKEERAAVINQAVTKGLDPSVKMKDSGVEWIGEMPDEWERIRLKWIVKEKLKYGANEYSELIDSNFPRYIRITDFDENGLLRNDTFKSLEPNIARSYLLSDGDILFARSGATVGKTFQFMNYEGKACFAGYLIKASPNETMITSDFLYFYTKSSAFENWKNSMFVLATIQNIGADKYQNLEVPLPSVEEQIAIVRYLSQITSSVDQTIAKTENQIKLLQEYRTALISEVVTGKVDVRREGSA